MKKTNTWLSLIAAVLAIGTLVGLVACLGRNTGPSKPAETTEETQEVVLTNKTADYAWRQSTVDGTRAYLMYSDTLTPKTKYRIEFDFNESDADVQAFLKQYSLTPAYAYDLRIPTAGDTFGWDLKTETEEGMKSGCYYDFETDENGVLVFRFFLGPKVSDDEAEYTDTDKAIVSFMKNRLSFRIVKNG